MSKIIQRVSGRNRPNVYCLSFQQFFNWTICQPVKDAFILLNFHFFLNPHMRICLLILYIEREDRGRERERDKERNMDQLLPICGT